MKIGKVQVLKISAENSTHFILGQDDEENIFLPKIFSDPICKVGNEVEVFVYNDKEQLFATTEIPFCEVDSFAVMTCVQVLPSGAFMDWGIIKDLFIPNKLQKIPMVNGKKYLVYVFLDKNTKRITGTTRFKKNIDYQENIFKKGEKVSLIISHKTQMGWNVVINQKYWGLIYFSDLYKDLYPLSEELGYIKNIRENGKIDISLQPQGFENISDFRKKILDKLEKDYGLVYLSDSSSPKEIKQELQMSKKNFKKAIGSLYKDNIIDIFEDKIRLK